MFPSAPQSYSQDGVIFSMYGGQAAPPPPPHQQPVAYFHQQPASAPQVLQFVQQPQQAPGGMCMVNTGTVGLQMQPAPGPNAYGGGAPYFLQGTIQQHPQPQQQQQQQQPQQPHLTQNVYATPVTGFVGSAPVAPQPNEYEVHDNVLKAPIAVDPRNTVTTTGSIRLFSAPPQPIVYGAHAISRICDAFHEGNCIAGSKCHDVHVLPDFLEATRQRLLHNLGVQEQQFNETRAASPDKTYRIFVADLKEVLDVPVQHLAFTKGLCIDPTTRAKRIKGSQLRVANPHVPTSCGLYASDPASCKWGRWCNQVHIDPRWMQQKKEVFGSWFSTLESHYDTLPLDHLFAVHDPQLHMTFSIPKCSIAAFSRGLMQTSSKKAPGVCLLFQRGRCTAGTCCNQIHVNPTYLHYCRQAQGARPEQQAATAAELRRITKELCDAAAAKRERQRQEQPQAGHKSQQDPATNGSSSGGPTSAEQSSVNPNLARDGPASGAAAAQNAGDRDAPGAAGQSTTEMPLIEHICIDDDDAPPPPPNRERPGASASSRHNPYGAANILTPALVADVSLTMRTSTGSAAQGAPRAGQHPADSSMRNSGAGPAQQYRDPAAAAYGYSSGSNRYGSPHNSNNIPRGYHPSTSGSINSFHQNASSSRNRSRGGRLAAFLHDVPPEEESRVSLPTAPEVALNFSYTNMADLNTSYNSTSRYNNSSGTRYADDAPYPHITM